MIQPVLPLHAVGDRATVVEPAADPARLLLALLRLLLVLLRLRHLAYVFGFELLAKYIIIT
jgi:hypothetical protein